MEEGYIYIYKCIVGSGSDVCKIGKTKHFQDNMDRLKQHSRTLYYGFVPYTEFTTGKPIATVFKVKDYDKSDDIIKKTFKKYQFSNIEIYNIDYDEAIEKIYNVLKKEDQILELIKDNYSEYRFLNDKNEIKTSKEEFRKVKEHLLSKFNNDLPEELLVMLRDKEDFKENCQSHYKTGNYVDFKDNMILDINFNKKKRAELLTELTDLLNK